jgi:hypothetical protein
MSPGQYRMLFKPDPSKTTRVGRPPGKSSVRA